MKPENIIVLDSTNLSYVIDVLTTARDNGQHVSIAVDGGVKVKRGWGMWTPPLGQTLPEYEGKPR